MCMKLPTHMPLVHVCRSMQGACKIWLQMTSGGGRGERGRRRCGGRGSGEKDYSSYLNHQTHTHIQVQHIQTVNERVSPSTSSRSHNPPFCVCSECMCE